MIISKKLMPCSVRSCLFSIVAVPYLLCACDRFNGEAYLGSGYYFVDAGKNSVIVLSTAQEHQWYRSMPAGKSILPERVIKFGYNDRYIGAVSYDKNKKRHFWLIDKQQKPPLLADPISDSVAPLDQERFNALRQPTVQGPLDSLQYATYASEHHINLQLSAW